jgi:hypothetical protein
LTTRVSKRLRCYHFNKKARFAKRKTNVKKNNTIRQTETQDNKPIKTQTGSRNPPEKINF